MVARLESVPASRRSASARLLRRFAPTLPAKIGWVIVAIVLLVGVLGPYIVPYPGDILGATHVLNSLQPSSAAHVFGTNEVGQDIFSLVVAGTRTSLLISFSIVVLSAVIGTAIGLVAGYVGGAMNQLLMGVTDVFLALPALVLAITFAGLLGPGLWQLIAALTLVWWPGYARLVAAEVNAVRNREFVDAAKAIGASHLQIALRHVLRSITSTILVKASLDLGYVILTAAGIGFIGLGVQPPTPEWGAMIAQSRQYMIQAWWYTFFPGMAIFFTIIGFNLAGDAIRDALDPRLANAPPGA